LGNWGEGKKKKREVILFSWLYNDHTLFGDVFHVFLTQSHTYHPVGEKYQKQKQNLFSLIGIKAWCHHHGGT
jgi:hypothetical protein